MLRPFFPEFVMSMDLLSFEYPSVLLFCFMHMYSHDQQYLKPSRYLVKRHSHMASYSICFDLPKKTTNSLLRFFFLRVNTARVSGKLGLLSAARVNDMKTIYPT